MVCVSNMDEFHMKDENWIKIMTKGINHSWVDSSPARSVERERVDVCVGWGGGDLVKTRVFFESERPAFLTLRRVAEKGRRR